MSHCQISISAARRICREHGYRLTKSRSTPHFNNCGLYMLVDCARNLVVLGDRYDASAESCVDYAEAHPRT